MSEISAVRIAFIPLPLCLIRTAFVAEAEIK
jgi:hypothetical protein